MDDVNLNLYWTPNRFYAPAVGRFYGIDKVADMFTSVSPMMYAFNNPLKFVDPTGLLSDLPEFTVTATRLPSFNIQYSILLTDLGMSHSPIERNLGMVASREGLNAANDLINRGQKNSYSHYEAMKYRDSEFMEGIRAMYKYGVTGSILAVAGGPILLEALTQSGVTRAIINSFVIGAESSGSSRLLSAGMETASQLATGTEFRDLDVIDIGAQSVFGFNTFGSILTGSVLDYRPLEKPSGALGFSVNTGNQALTNLGTGAVSGLSTDFIMRNVKSPSASFVLFLGTDMVMKFNANQINKVAND
jgi:RHS repeat-associated protein